MAYQLTATGALPITAMALLCASTALDDTARRAITAALSTPVTHKNHMLAWSLNGVSLAVPTVREPDDLYHAQLIIEPEDAAPADSAAGA